MNAPDFARIQMLLDIVHNSIDVPGLNMVRRSAMDELNGIEADLNKQHEADVVEYKKHTDADAAKAAAIADRNRLGPVDAFGRPMAPVVNYDANSNVIGPITGLDANGNTINPNDPNVKLDQYGQPITNYDRSGSTPIPRVIPASTFTSDNPNPPPYVNETTVDTTNPTNKRFNLGDGK